MIKVVYGMLVSDDDDRKVNDIVRWCNDHPLKKKDVYENNAYGLKHKCEKDLGFYVSQDDIATVYRWLGNDVEQIKSPIYLDGYCWKIGR